MRFGEDDEAAVRAVDPLLRRHGHRVADVLQHRVHPDARALLEGGVQGLLGAAEDIVRRQLQDVHHLRAEVLLLQLLGNLTDKLLAVQCHDLLLV
ncbi:MAG: hypothetical protein EBS89_11305 [Proteobacteria bacterium]|nr:hypothetical protein [Pseudomonadota bacterium]